MKSRLLCCSVLFWALVFTAHAQLKEQKITVGSRQRTYYLYTPANLSKERPTPLVIVLHGGGGNGKQVAKHTKFSELAEKENFIAAYPEGIDKNWNDGREDIKATAFKENIDDLGFIAAMITEIETSYNIDPRRIYATGISNGAIFSHYIAGNMSEKIAAIAPVCGGIAEPYAPRFKPVVPVSILMIQGEKDPLTPYAGGGVVKGRRGRILSTADTMKKWMENNGCEKMGAEMPLPDTDPKDGCHAFLSISSVGRNGTQLELIRIEGGGHTWPGASSFLPQFIVGKVCRDFNATEVIWEFFKSHSKP